MLGLTRAGDRRGPALAAVLLAAALALPFLTAGYYVQFATKVLLTGIAAMGLNLAVGFGGMVSLCHAAFFGLAGYALALATPRYEEASLFWTLPLAVGAAALAALAIGALSLRTRGVYFIMVTLAFGQMLFFLFFDNDFAGGSDGTYIYTKPAVAVAGATLLDLDKPRNLYLLVLALTVGVAAGLVRVTRSPFGRALVAARHNERRALSLGFPVYRIRLAAYVLSGAIAGLAGYFAAAQFGFVAPQMLGWHASALMLVTVVLGGLGSVTGPLVGAVALLGLEEVLKSWTEYWAVAEGVIIAGIVLKLPGGVRQLAELVRGRGAGRAPSPLAGEGGLRVSEGRMRGRAVTSQHAEAQAGTIGEVTAHPSSVAASPRHLLPQGEKEIALAAEGLSKSFGGLRAVRDVSLEVRTGEIHAVIGPNGAGKTTLVNLLSGDLRPSAGTIRLGGRDIGRLGPDGRGRAGLGRSYQKTTLFLRFTAFENARLAAQARAPGALAPWRAAESDNAVAARARAALAAVGLAGRAEAVAGELSHGEQRALEIATVLATEPAVILLDEPLAGMGAAEADAMVRLIRTLKGGRAVLLVEHDMDAVFALADTLTVMADGQVIAQGPPAAVRAHPAVRAAYLGEAA